MIIDVHAHCGKWFFPTFCEEAETVSKICDRFDIGRAVFSSSKAITYDMEAGNRDTAVFVEKDERFFGHLYLNPSDPRGSEREIRKYMARDRFVGVKLHPSYSGKSADSESTLRLLSHLPEGTPVLVHTWGESGVREVSRLAREAVSLRVIMGHMGGTDRNGWMAGIAAAAERENLFLEPCGSLLHRDRIAIAVEKAGADKLLFGTDMTLIDPSFSLGQILGASITEDAKRRILETNALNLFDF